MKNVSKLFFALLIGASMSSAGLFAAGASITVSNETPFDLEYNGIMKDQENTEEWVGSLPTGKKDEIFPMVSRDGSILGSVKLTIYLPETEYKTGARLMQKSAARQYVGSSDAAVVSVIPGKGTLVELSALSSPRKVLKTTGTEMLAKMIEQQSQSLNTTVSAVPAYVISAQKAANGSVNVRIKMISKISQGGMEAYSE